MSLEGHSRTNGELYYQNSASDCTITHCLLVAMCWVVWQHSHILGHRTNQVTISLCKHYKRLYPTSRSHLYYNILLNISDTLNFHLHLLNPLRSFQCSHKKNSPLLCSKSLLCTWTNALLSSISSSLCSLANSKLTGCGI